ncbi:hypothetical protein O3Q52_35485 [Streptomyces sp. ActVer]|uniref:hypothetical protein n=1 Tax=Streptomyces sp. ActVer TaxID=3014558 RepID=UPI0022B5BAD3|nr:hypothetical protein [Streptomyces sp. ActVer]MCZ4513366.1 hypothetical protein [Streptomyces sp. ActVer]
MPGTLSLHRDRIGRAATHPDSYAEITDCARSRTPSLAGTPLTWDFTVPLPTPDRAGDLASTTVRALVALLAGAGGLRRRDA